MASKEEKLTAPLLPAVQPAPLLPAVQPAPLSAAVQPAAQLAAVGGRAVGVVWLGGQYSRTEGSSHTPCSSLRVEGPQASNMVVARGEDSENPDLSQFCVKKRRFWRAAPQVNEDFLRAR